jgi:GNAT superfamily N-acetyltransferase
VRWSGPDGYWASDDRALIDVPRVHGWLSREAYWARGRTADVVARSVEHSLVVGLYAPDGAQVGFARFVTDYATFGWLCDVFVDAGHRGHGLGTFLAKATIEHPQVAEIHQVLATAPGRTLYARYGFAPLASAERWMERRRDLADTPVTAVASGAPRPGLHRCGQPGVTRGSR